MIVELAEGSVLGWLGSWNNPYENIGASFPKKICSPAKGKYTPGCLAGMGWIPHEIMIFLIIYSWFSTCSPRVMFSSIKLVSSNDLKMFEQHAKQKENKWNMKEQIFKTEKKQEAT